MREYVYVDRVADTNSLQLSTSFTLGRTAMALSRAELVEHQCSLLRSVSPLVV